MRNPKVEFVDFVAAHWHWMMGPVKGFVHNRIYTIDKDWNRRWFMVCERYQKIGFHSKLAAHPASSGSIVKAQPTHPIGMLQDHNTPYHV